MSNTYTDKFKEDLFEKLLEEVEMKCFVGLNALGEPAFTKTDREIEIEVTELVNNSEIELKAIEDRNGF
jgi:hypothetical protein|tara:strand:- start:203 stop:409 length:207 start_codon:yes stop_codon:yes gene_type:complete